MKKFLSLNKNRIFITALLFFVACVFFNFAFINPVFGEEEGGGANGGLYGTVQPYSPSTPTNSDNLPIQGLSGAGKAVITIVSWIAYAIGYVIGMILTVVLNAMVNVAKFNSITNVDAVVNGWVIIRDICNMVFVVALLVIAFATILRIESYQWQKMLPKLLIMAVLINFSRTIFGIIVDAAQVVMLTFVSGFADYGANNFVSLFQIDKYLSWESKSGGLEKSGEISSWGIVAGILAGVIALIITLIVVVVMLVVLVMRVIMLWVYTVLSPFVFLGFAFPPVGKYTGQIWNDFINNVVSGPVLAFFIWLALTTAQTSSNQASSASIPGLDGSSAMQGTVNLCGSGSGLTMLYCDKSFQTFIIVIAMLVGGLIVTQKLGGIAGNMAGRGMGWIKKGQGFVTSKALQKTKDVSRISAAQEYLKMRSAEKQKIRTAKIQSDAHWIADKAGKVKENTVGKVGNFAYKQWGRFGRNEATKLREQAVQDSMNLREIESGSGLAYNKLNEKVQQRFNSFQSGDKFSDIQTGERFIKQGGAWSAISRTGNTRTVDDDDVKKFLLNQEVNIEKEKLKIGIEQKRNEAKRHEKRQKWANGIATAGMLAGGTMLFGAAGPGWIANAIGAAAGTGAGYKVIKAAKDGGKMDNGMVSKYRIEQINTSKDGMKNDSDSEVLAKMDDQSQSAFTRAAAAMEAMSRKLLDAQQVKSIRNELQPKLGGAKKGDMGDVKDWNDKKLNSQFEAIVKKNYPGATKDFEKISQTGDDAERAKIRIQEGFNDGSLTMKDMDIDSLTKSIDELAKGIKNSKFVNDFKELNDVKQKKIIEALEKSSSYEAKAKLAMVTNIERAFGRGAATQADNEMKHKYVQGLSYDDFRGIMTKGNADQVRALREALNGDPNNLPERVRRITTPEANGLKNAAGVGNQP